MVRLIYLCWLFPIVTLITTIAGYLRYLLTHRRYMGTSGATEAIIQVTTIGNYETVNEIIRGVRSYDLPFPYQFWVVVEPGVAHHYVGADEVIVVPEEFSCLARYKARAQEYSRRVREARGLDRHDVKIIMLDDDSLPTRQYFIDVFGADYDICEGILAPRIGYGRFLSHLDDLRTLSCITECGFWQGIGHPIWVHGEGLTLRGSAEAMVTWNFPVTASEDLTVGQNAVERGLRFGFVYSVIQVTSPWTWSDFKKQRRRWIWGNLYALRTGTLPPLATALVSVRWVVGLVVQILGSVGIFLLPVVYWRTPSPAQWLLWIALGTFFGQFAVISWIGSNDQGATLRLRLWNTLVGTLLAPVSSFMTTYVLIVSLFKGEPKSFEVIAKLKPVAA
jgi:multisubunit Na+/H+ antiporter MnhG subunit